MRTSDSDSERASFRLQVLQDHGRVDPCFMTGKGCVYTEVIEHERESRQASEPAEVAGFMIMPFKQHLGVFYQNCLTPFFQHNYDQPGRNGKSTLELSRGDSMRRPGVVICEGICKRIQESDFVVADISVPNANVFYELGLAYGINQKILVIHHGLDSAVFGHHMARYLREAGCNAYAYSDLDLIESRELKLSHRLWSRERADPTLDGQGAGILLYERRLDPQDFAEDPAKDELRVEDRRETLLNWLASAVNAPVDASAFDNGPPADIDLSFDTQVQSAIGLSISKIHEDLESQPDLSEVLSDYHEAIKGLAHNIRMVVNPTTAQFRNIREMVDRSYCLIIRTGRKAHPMSYFWLGYGHARGKNVIPITVIRNPKDPVDDLAFDIRAQRHMTFVESEPDGLVVDLREALRQMIRSDFSHWSRKRFWDNMIGRRGEVSIFTGALHNDTFHREMIGDWDLRTASELTSYFGRHQYRAKIETPVYSPERPGTESPLDPGEYIRQLEQMLAGKNCILIASPDVNPFTEIVLGKIYGVPSEQLFKTMRPGEMSDYPGATVAFKQRAELTEGSAAAQRAFYREITKEDGRSLRGFESTEIIGGRVEEKFVSQEGGRQSFEVYANLTIVPNPFAPVGREEDGGPPTPDDQRKKYIIILNGLSGPATFALTHVLTGGVNSEFVAYDEGFDPGAASERALNEILDELVTAGQRHLERFVLVHGGPGGDDHDRRIGATADWRRIKSWEVQAGVMKPR